MNANRDGGKPAPRWAAIILLAALIVIAVIAVYTAFRDPPAHADPPPAPPLLPPAPPLEMKPGADPAVRRLRRKLHHARLQLRHERRHTRQLEAVNRQRLHLGGEGLIRDFLCIHHFEGSWHADTGNGYYGGLQMDTTFQRAYGGEFYRAWGTANNWPPIVQLTVGMRAYFWRGFEPWPNTSRACGLR